MTTGKSKTKAANPKAQLKVTLPQGKSEARALAEVCHNPAAHGMTTVTLFNNGSFGSQDSTETFNVLREQADAAKDGNLSHYRAMLAMQADSLNSLFTELARRAAINMGDYLNATQTYLRLGLKAQAQCRTTIETLERMTAGHVQTVKHVHVNEGGQAVIADQFHHHGGGRKNGEGSEQPHATGTGAAGGGPALSGPDPLGGTVPVPGGERQVAMQNARGKG